MNTLRHLTMIGVLLAAMMWLAGCSNDEEESAATDAPETAAAIEGSAAPEAAPDAPLVSTQFEVQSAGGGDFDPIEAYDDECPDDDDDPSLECEWLRGFVVADVVEALEAIGNSKDQRGTEEAVAALDIDDEPEVLVAACRVLGRFPETPGIAEPLTALMLDSPYLEVQRMAAEVLNQGSQPALAEMANQWISHHDSLLSEDPYDPMPGIPAHYESMAFPHYPDAEWFTPADSDRSVGWSTPEAVDKVVAWLSDELDVGAQGYQQWVDRLQQEAGAVMESFDTAKMEEIQKLTEEYIRTQDQKLMERMDQLQAEISAQMDQAGQANEMNVNNVLLPPGTADPEQVHYLIAEEKAGHAARVILVYRQPALDRTVIQTAWDLRDYPRAWGSE